MIGLMGLRPSQRRLLDEVARELESEISVPDARRLLEARNNKDLVLASPHLQPIAFAVRHTTWRNYVYGVAGEVVAWAVFIFFTILWLLASAGVGMVALLALFNLHLQALQLLKDSLPEFYKKQKRSVQRFERQRWSAQRRRHNIYKRFCVDTRPPILYLRSFSFDVVYELPLEVVRKVDERLAEHYEQYGPVIAVAGPDDKGYMSGPVRLYFDDDIWRAGVTYLMSVSQLVIIQAGITHGTLWELGVARRLLDPERLIISVADASNPNVADDFYYDFRKYAEVILGSELPESLGSCVHLGFGKGWKVFPQDPRILVSEKEEWALFKAAERERGRRTYDGGSGSGGAPGYACRHRTKKFFDWGRGWEETTACERCGGVLKLEFERPADVEDELYRKLLRKSFGDKAQVERLIEVERRKKPNAHRAVWMKNAIERWEKDNR